MDHIKIIKKCLEGIENDTGMVMKFESEKTALLAVRYCNGMANKALTALAQLETGMQPTANEDLNIKDPFNNLPRKDMEIK